MSGFTRGEFLGVLAILAIVAILALYNFQVSAVKARDEQRKANARAIVYALESYHKDFGKFPPSKDGKIFACGTPQEPKTCDWGVDKLADIADPSYLAYIDPIPYDPQQGQGNSLFYLSNGSEFQIFGHLERREDPEWGEYVASLGLTCGQSLCNYGITLGTKPVRKILEVGQ